MQIVTFGPNKNTRPWAGARRRMLLNRGRCFSCGNPPARKPERSAPEVKMKGAKAAYGFNTRLAETLTLDGKKS